MSGGILLSAVGRRRYVVEELMRAAGLGDLVLVADEDPRAPGLFVDGAIRVAPRGDRSPADWIGEIRTQYSVDAILSLHDYDIMRLAEYSSEFRALDVRLIGPALEASKLFLDKILLHEHIIARDPSLTVPTTPATVPFSEDGSRYVLKDRFGSGSSGLQIVTTNEERENAVVDAKRRAVWTPFGGSGGELVRQSVAAGREFNVDLFFSKPGVLSGHCVKEKLTMRGGETDTARVRVDDFSGLVARISQCFVDVDIVGNVDIDVFIDGDDVSIIDVNPRFGGGFAFSALAGYDAASGIWRISAGEELPEYIQPARELYAAKFVSVAEIAETKPV